MKDRPFRSQRGKFPIVRGPKDICRCGRPLGGVVYKKGGVVVCRICFNEKGRA